MATRREARAVLRLRREAIMRLPNVIGTGIGYKNGDPEAGWSIRVFVSKRKKVRKGRVPSVVRPPRASGLPNVQTDVEEIGAVEFDVGVSVGLGINVEGRTGVCACVLQNVGDGRRYGLTAGHVASPKFMFHPLKKSGFIPQRSRPRVTGVNGFTGWVLRCSTRAGGRPIDLALIVSEDFSGSGSPAVKGFRNVTQRPLHKGELFKILISKNRFLSSQYDNSSEDQFIEMRIPIRDVHGIHEARLRLVEYQPANTIDGHSGSAVVDKDGQLIGIHVARSASRGIGYAIPTPDITRWAPKKAIAVG